MDETGYQPRKDVAGKTAKKVWTRVHSRQESREPLFRIESRMTLLAVVFANGERGRPLWIYEGE